MEDVKFKMVEFEESGKGQIFYDITLPNAVKKMKELGNDPVKNMKMKISVFYY